MEREYKIKRFVIRTSHINKRNKSSKLSYVKNKKNGPYEMIRRNKIRIHRRSGGYTRYTMPLSIITLQRDVRLAPSELNSNRQRPTVDETVIRIMFIRKTQTVCAV